MNSPLPTRISEAEILARVTSLPPLSAVVHQLELALHDETASTERIVALIGRDQALTAAALKLANSSFYGVSGRVLSLRDAVHILGLRTLSAAVTTAAVVASFDRAACPGFDFDGCWRHALAVAHGAQMLAEAREADTCAAYAVGLLHDIGTLALATHFPQPFAATLAWAAANDQPSVVAERELLGIDHAVVGSLVARHWRFAPVVVDAIRLHHEVPEAPADLGLLDIVHLADNVAHALDLSHAVDDMVPPLSLGAWRRVGLTGAELQQLFGGIEARMASVGFGAAR